MSLTSEKTNFVCKQICYRFSSIFRHQKIETNLKLSNKKKFLFNFVR